MYTFSLGSGTEGDPFVIESIADLEGIKDVDSLGNPNYENRWYLLANDIDFSGYDWDPIPELTTVHFDGQGHKLHNITKIDASYNDTSNGRDYAVLFKSGDELSISNLTIEDVYIEITLETGYNDGSVAVLGVFLSNSVIDNVTLRNCIVKAHRAKDGIAGLVVKGSATTYSNCVIENIAFTAQGGTIPTIGGFVALSNSDSFTDCELDQMTIDGSGLTYTVGGIAASMNVGSFDGCVAKNLDFDFEFITGGDEYVGGMLGYGTEVTMDDCHVFHVVISDAFYAAGMACEIDGDHYDAFPFEYGFDDCTVIDCTISNAYGGAGGFACYVWNSVHAIDCYALGVDITCQADAAGFACYAGGYAYFEGCIAKGSVITGDYWELVCAGGFAAWGHWSRFIECGAEVSVTATYGSTSSGGFIGSLYTESGKPSLFEDCYALGNVSAVDGAYAFTGGFVGETYGGSPTLVTMQRCFSKGAVSVLSTGEAGGFAGSVEANIFADNYYDSQTSGFSDTKGASPKTTEAMKTEDTFENWNFEDTWIIGKFSEGNLRSISDEFGVYGINIEDGNIKIFVVRDLSNGYPYLQFEAKKVLEKSGDVEVDWYVR